MKNQKNKKTPKSINGKRALQAKQKLINNSKKNKKIYLEEIKSTLSEYKEKRIQSKKERLIYLNQKNEHKRQKKTQNKLTRKLSGSIIDASKIFVSEEGFEPDIEKNIIEIKNVEKTYVSLGSYNKILKKISVSIQRGEIVAILGSSGGGKTTLLNIIGGLDKADSGDVLVNGYNLSFLGDNHLTLFRRKFIGFVFQQYNLLPSLTAKENVEIGFNLASRSKSNVLTMDEIIDVVGLTARRNNYPNQMSGGEQQRVSIARALAKNPEILFCDEPTGALDKEMAENVLDTLISINKRLKTTIILITHNQQIGLVANKVIEMAGGNIKKTTINEKPLSPKNLRWT